MKKFIIIATVLACDESIRPPPLSEHVKLEPRVIGEFTFEQSSCRIVEISKNWGNRWYPQTRIVLCDPPLKGQCVQGSAPNFSKGGDHAL